MAEAATTRPVRKRTTTTPTAASAATKRAKAEVTKPAAAAVVTKPAAVPAVSDDGMVKFGFTLEAAGETKNYAVFVPPKSSGVVGKLYFPLGTAEVKALMIGPASA